MIGAATHLPPGKKSCGFDRSQGNRAAFVRNDRILGLKPVEAVICEGSGIQQNLAQKLRQAGVPLHIVRLAHQRTAQRA